jgi:proline dehydrogenase
MGKSPLLNHDIARTLPLVPKNIVRLLGVEEHLREIMLAVGHKVLIYMPFGRYWYAYSVRRLRENPQLAGYAFKGDVQIMFTQ